MLPLVISVTRREAGEEDEDTVTDEVPVLAPVVDFRVVVALARASSCSRFNRRSSKSLVLQLLRILVVEVTVPRVRILATEQLSSLSITLEVEE